VEGLLTDIVAVTAARNAHLREASTASVSPAPRRLRAP
jgi:hypothetical protein